MSRSELVLRPHAASDLEALNDFIIENSGAARATAFLLRIREVCLSLLDFPEKGRRRDDLAPGIRTIAVDRRTVIAYRVLDHSVSIVRVFYAGRDFSGVDFEES